VLPPRLRYFDPRPTEEAARRPIADSVNIPFDELLGRLEELPPRSEPLLVAADGDLLRRVTGLLEGRTVELAEDCDFAEQPTRGRLWEPNAFLMEVLAQLKPGRAIDLGCGSGRNAVALAAYGWQVTAVDNLPDALERGTRLAARYVPEQADQISWVQRDLEKDGLPDGEFDLACLFFFLDRNLLEALPQKLNPRGSIVLETFTTIHREHFGKPRSDAYLLSPDELPELLSPLETQIYEAGWHGGRHTGQVWACKAL
jgi:tellurite methyltransferase